MALLPSNPIPERSQSTPKESLFILVGNIAIAKRSEGIAFYSNGKSNIAIAKHSEGIASYSSGKYSDRSFILVGNIAIAKHSVKIATISF
ncbi:hypothetical protein MEO40_05905 [Dolichospermum sp. ST_sed1]|nr:hypothetical protein [Dolichospermum sp. ST_sed1]MDD1425265.1 hypothetical protein [Dolichospermum sp. ST_sed9]MDD1430475.1 hypothetical protein [Dolichospermum sp. ST_sed6]MDD1439168.1 hypothetical protein [Dolichospermum sp. ST_sed3]MDD1445237.1 hypothetical protein [Dolichospermum sp. ST_sed8]MDD1455096.1 hypothetical protein [Dolichospermum sp. ST_sed7]MDD1459692.1 hypothetical protein [Dolichospermum sp. ST_sed2]MDD1463971.1 hypothetical protein [Dolichospermum sp. ST_sed5]MDD147040